MATVSSESKRSRLAGFIRSFRTPPPNKREDDWYIPYHGPIEDPKPYSLSNYDPFERAPSTLVPPIDQFGSHEGRSSLTEFESKRRVSHSSYQSRPSAGTVDGGSIGDSPVAVHTNSDRKKIGPRSSRDLPFAHWTSLRHPFDPLSNSILSLPASSGLSIPPTVSQTSFTQQPATFQFDRPHPYSASAFGQSALQIESYSAPDKSQVPKPVRRSRAFTTGHTPSHLSHSPASRQSITEAIKPPPRVRPEVRFQKEQTFTFPQSQPTLLSIPAVPSPSYSLESHPFATSRAIQTKPPIPSKSPQVLRRLRSSTSAPNLLEKALRLNGLPSRVHNLPLTLAPESTMQAVMHPRPKFLATHIVAADPPVSPYSLAPPILTSHDSEPIVLSKCLPTSIRSIKDRRPLSPIQSTPVERKPSLDDVLEQVVREHKQLSAERAHWASVAERGFGNKRSRSLSDPRSSRYIRRARSPDVGDRGQRGSGSRDYTTSGTDVGGTETGTVATSRSTFHHGSLKYLAATAFGHTRTPTVTVDGSAAASLSRQSSERQGTHSQKNSVRTHGDSSFDAVGFHRKDSVRAVIEPAPRAVLRGASPINRAPGPEPSSTGVVNIGREHGALKLPEDTIGVALSVPLTAEERRPSPSIKAGPHPSFPVLVWSLPDRGDTANRHRLPPQAQLHRRSSSNDKSSSSFTPSESRSTVPLSDATLTSVSSHPFATAGLEGRSRPYSGWVKESFEKEMMEANRSSWLERSIGNSSPWAEIGPELGSAPSHATQGDARALGVSPLVESQSPTSQSNSLQASSLFGQRPFRRGGNARRSLSASGATRPVERAFQHERSASLSARYTSPFGSLTLSDITSSFGSSPQPELVIGGSDDLEEFRDLFYRPDSGLLLNVPQSSTRADSPTYQDSSGAWLRASFGTGTEEGDKLMGEHNSTLGDREKESEYGSVHVGEVGSSLPSVQDTIQRHSSAPIIEPLISLPQLVLPDATRDDCPGSTGTVSLPLQSDGLLPSQFVGSISSGSEDGGLEFHPGDRVSHIIRDFPTPPDMTPTAATVLDSYFAELSTAEEGLPPSPRYAQRDLEHSS